MRLYLAPVTGTGYPIVYTLPVDEQYTAFDPPFELITESWVNDEVRPDATVIHGSTYTLIQRPRPSAIDRFLVYDSGDMAVDGTPVGCENIVGGNSQATAHPGAVVRMNTPLIIARKNTLEDFLGQPRGTFMTDGTNWTPRELMRWMVGPGWRQRIGANSVGSDDS